MAQKGPWRNQHGVEAFNAKGYRISELRTYDRHGRKLTHHTWFNPESDRRISYDTYDGGFAVGNVYVYGSGHEVHNTSGKILDRWDNVSSYERFDAYGNVAEVVFGM